jgi:hypothetical protein
MKNVSGKGGKMNLLGWVHTGNNSFQWLYFRAAFKELVRNTARQHSEKSNTLLYFLFVLATQNSHWCTAL